MKDKRILSPGAILILMLVFSDPSYAEGSPLGSSPPLHVLTPAVYSLARPVFEMWENRESGGYEKQEKLKLDMEYALSGYCSLSLSTGFIRRDRSETERINKPDRWGAGLKFFTGERYERGSLAWGVGARFLSKIRLPTLEDENVDFFRTGIYGGVARRAGNFEMGISLQFETETNINFRENGRDEFRRHYQSDLYLIWNPARHLRLFLESEYRMPYDKQIDLNTLYWNAYPGISYSFNDSQAAGVSFLVPLLKEGYADRGIQFSYTYFIK